MDDCRICLKCMGDKDIFQLEAEKVNESKNFLELLVFCLDIVVSPNFIYGRKICSDCYIKIIEFNKFKTLALKNNTYLLNLQLNGNIANDVLLKDRIKCENNFDEISNNNENDVKNSECFSSDDEFLSAIKQIKCENNLEETKENDHVAEEVFKKKKKENLKVYKKRNQICEQCGKTVVNLEKHSRLHKSVDERKCFKCEECDKSFSSLSARYRHYRTKHLGIKSHCDICDKDVVDLRSHTLMMHNAEDMQYVCIPCGKRFISQSVLDLHSTIHTKQLAYACDICDKKFRCKITMMSHKRQVHDKEKSHLCQFCSKGFFKKYHLQVHLRSHTKEKPYQCQDCKKYFTTRNSLKTHQFIHTGVKMFACSLCDMTFANPGYISAHMRIHTKEKRHQCKYCDARFGRSDHRKRHEVNVHERNYGLINKK
ncbi:PREDICTED: zinc finger protein 235-like isoform X1 [Papilio xuthus]|uniref:Zinc finger protein 235-like isoform X1 n=1 Tax=Papilio xuthus TaxID=66420 RepID=A0AAJ6ZBK6_PAPXU|nr:PREDICTED: zinc finger protein 235-like isoform X1 [Papilio xuthus]